MLNRVLCYTEDGYEHEADPRQAEKLLEGFGSGGGCNPAATPGVKPLVGQLEKDSPVPAGGHTEFRGQAARANYLPADLFDLQSAARRSAAL